jgi:hypothetical protein
MNIFQGSYENRLQGWFTLRTNLNNLSIKNQCIEIDKWWQKTPLVNHYLHTDFMHEWPGPWELIVENNYCLYARALGMIYTLLLLGVKDIDFVDAIDNNNEDVVLVLVDNAKYILNYWPDTVVNNCLQDFKITKQHSLKPIITKIGQI